MPVAILVAAGAVGISFWVIDGHPQSDQQPAALESPATTTFATPMTTPTAGTVLTPDEAPLPPTTPPPALTATAAPAPIPVVVAPPPVAPDAPPLDDLPIREAAALIPRPLCSTSLAGTQPHVAQVGNFLRAMFGIKDIGGAVGRAGDGDHGAGLALDLMMPNPELGTKVAGYVLSHQKAFGVTYVIWQQQYNDGGGWSMMEDRGSPTQNHMDHVHVSFAPSSDVGLTC
ncbi:hypothetical protein [Skermania piniformis]|uniref:ARB-07466-like C-terminal domain-containing protein n=1 Tax=Skermania pinensis TaxID=39122 RepID=A0ABX8S788_9ACTN|nr:hypothetical protein [Skermania piniformis]QXQ12887.1 hypothetical protein KV203_13285 [Skermania piniformis]